MPIPLVAWEVGAIVVGSLAKAFSYEKSDTWSPQEEQYAQTVERFKQIKEQRQAAISFAAGISGLPESTFYGRKGLRLMGSKETKVGETPATQGAKVAEVKAYESQLDTGNAQPPSASVRKFEQAPTYADAARNTPRIQEQANQTTATRLANENKTVRNSTSTDAYGRETTASEVWDDVAKRWRKFTPDASGKGYQPASQQYGGG